MIDAETLKRLLETEVYDRLAEFYVRQLTTLPKPEFKTFYAFLEGDVAKEFFDHPAKMSPWLSAALWGAVDVGVEDTVLDPMCGVGGTVIPGLLLNPPRVLILNDIVDSYVNTAKTICEDVINALGLPTRVEAYVMNASCLYEKVGRRSVDAVITSPPYGRIQRASNHGLPIRQEYRGGGWGDLATFHNGHYRAALLQVITSVYLVLDQGGRAAINLKNTRTSKNKLPPLTAIVEDQMGYVGFKDIRKTEFTLRYDTPGILVRRARGEDTSHLQKEYVVTGVKP